MKKEQLEKDAVKSINGKLSEQLQRVKCNYRINLTSKGAIINESRKSISAVYRSGIKSLLINTLSDCNVDLLNVTFVRRALKDDGINFDTIPEKFTLVRSGEFVQCSIDNYLISEEKLLNTISVVITIWFTDVDSFESKSSNIRFDIPFVDIPFDKIVSSPNLVLDSIFTGLVINL